MAKQKPNVGRVRNHRELAALSQREQEARARALEAVSEARVGGLSLSAAARRAGTTVATVRRYAEPALERLSSGRYKVKPDDQLYRRLRVISTEGVVWVDVRGSRAARVASEHANAVREYGLTGDESVFARLRGRRIGGVTLETNPAVLALVASAGELDAFDLYEESAS